MISVLVLAKYSPHHPGGIETAIREFLKYAELKQDEFKIDVYCYGEASTDSAWAPHIMIRQYETTFTIWSTPFSVSMFHEIRKWVKTYDVVHLHLPNPWGACLALLFGRGRRLVVSFHGVTTRYPLLQFPEKLITKKVLDRASQIVVSAAENVQCYGLEKYRDRITVIPYGISDRVARVQPCRVILKEPFFLFVGILVYYKGLEYLLKAMRSVPGHLIIVGEGPLHDRLNTLIRQLDLDESVTMAGPVSREELANYYERCLAFVLPSITVSESFGLSVLEAMSFGKPLVVTQLGTGVQTLVRDSENGFVVPPMDVAGLAAALNALLENRQQANAFGIASRKLFLERFSMKQTNAKLIELYERTSIAAN